MQAQVLIADPDELLLAVYRTYLAAEGLEAITVTNGLDCVAALRRSAPAALVLDTEIPWGSAEGVLAVLREEAGMPAVPVLILTVGHEMPATPFVTLADVAVLLKPVAPAQVARVVRMLLEAGTCCANRRPAAVRLKGGRV